MIFLQEFTNNDTPQNSNPQGSSEVNTLEIEIQKPDGTIKKVRISYFQTKSKGDDRMLAELRQKAQVTIPREIIVKLGLSEGDKLDIFEKDGSICIMPVVVYPKHYLNELKEEISDVKAKLASGEQPVFDSVDALFDKLEAE